MRKKCHKKNIDLKEKNISAWDGLNRSLTRQTSQNIFYADDNEEFIPSFCGTSNNSREISLKTDDYQFPYEDQIVPSSEQNTLGEEATIEVPLEQQATSLKEQINTDDNFNLIEKKQRKRKTLQRKTKKI